MLEQRVCGLERSQNHRSFDLNLFVQDSLDQQLIKLPFDIELIHFTDVIACIPEWASERHWTYLHAILNCMYIPRAIATTFKLSSKEFTY